MSPPMSVHNKEVTQQPLHHVQTSQKRPTIGYVAPDIHGASQIQWRGILDASQKYDLNLICFPGSSLHIPLGFRSQSNILYDLVNSNTVDGIVSWASAIGNYTDIEEIRTFHERYRPLPVVTIGRTLPGFPCLLMSSYEGMYEALIHLLEEHGYRRIAFIRGPEDHFYAQERFRAYTDALKAYDIPFDPYLVTPPFSWETSMGKEAMQILLDERLLRPQIDVEAVVSANDHMLLGALEVLQTRGIHVPGEVALVGFDDIELGRTSMPPFTSVRVPYYEIGYQAVEMVLALLEGQPVPDEVIIPSRLVVHRSCGCLDTTVTRAVVNEVKRSAQGFIATVAIRREQILESMQQELEFPVPGLEPNWAESLLAAFIASVQKEPSDVFLKVFDDVLRQIIAKQGDVAAWQNVISAMQRQMLPCFSGHETSEIHQADNLWQQARVMIGEASQRAQIRREVQTGQWAETLRRIGAELITTFDVSALTEVLARELPQVGIPACYLALYDDCAEPDNRTLYIYPDAAPERLRLILAYNEAGHIPLTPEGSHFPSCQLVPKEVLPQQRRYSLVVEPLYFREHQIGCAVFEVGPRDGNIYVALQAEISSALQGDLLVQQVQEHAEEIDRQNAEITRQKHVLDTFMATVPDRICFKDREGRFTNANRAYAEWIGVGDPEKLLGKTEMNFFPEEDARKHAEQEQIILRTGHPLLDMEDQQIWPDGRVSWSLTTKMPLYDEHRQIVGTFSISRDITHLKHTEQELMRYRDHLEDLVRERTEELTRSNARLHEEIAERGRAEQALWVSEQQYRLLAENVMDGIVIVQDEKIVFANAAFAALFRYPLAHLLGGNPVTLFPDYVKHTANDRLAYNDHVDSEPHWQVEIMTGDGQMIWAEINRTSMMWDNRPALLLTVRNITQRKLQEIRMEQERTRLQQENLAFKSTISDRYRFGPLIGKSLAMQRVYELIISAAASDVNVLLVGESGTGKELIARTLHQISTRKMEAFVPVNCASIPETLFEREFFGHRKGTFTGADRDKGGLFDRAHKGTLFLDEVTELNPGAQAKLLRVLQDGEYVPLGSNIPQQANVLLIAATNKDCQEEIVQGRLRKDFFYRIGVIEINVPPLRERKEDLPFLIEHILEQYRQKQLEVHGSAPYDLPTDQTMLPGDLIQALYAYDWPGNVRELQNALQRYLATNRLDTVIPLSTNSRGLHPLPEITLPSPEMTLSETLQRVEKYVIADLLAKNRYHKSKTAQMLGISRSTLHIKIKRYQLEK